MISLSHVLRAAHSCASVQVESSLNKVAFETGSLFSPVRIEIMLETTPTTLLSTSMGMKLVAERRA